MSEPPIGSPEDEDLWRRVSAAESASSPGFPEPDLLLDLAAYAEGRLEGERLAALEALLGTAPELAGDAAYAASLIDGARDRGAGIECDLIAFPARPASRRRLSPVVSWGALAASLLLVGYFGFNLGDAAYTRFAVLANPSATFLDQDLMDSPGGFGEPGEG